MHHPNCIRTDGDWFCARGCTHNRDEARAEERQSLIDENETLRRVLGEIARGHPNPVLHAASVLASLNSERADSRKDSA